MKNPYLTTVSYSAKIRKYLKSGKRVLYAGQLVTHARSKHYTLQARVHGKYCNVNGDGSPLLFLS